MSLDMNMLLERCQRVQHDIGQFLQPVAQGSVRWLENGPQLRMVQSPLDIAQTMQNRVMSTVEASDAAGKAWAERDGTPKSWIFTSATLGSDADLSWFMESCGLQGARAVRVDSPFDYMAQAALYVPQEFPRPSEASHSACVAALVADAATVLHGRTLVLTTTLRAMRQIGEALRLHFQGEGQITVLVQGQLSKRELVERLGQGAQTTGGACILVASASFWEGIDIPGEALQLVVIDKLPFPPPDDPLVQARSNDLKQRGKNPFQHHHIPLATIALKQGAGRLIRSETDRGILVVCDTRLVEMGYGRRILSKLPAMQTLQSLDDFTREVQALRALQSPTKPSTTDLC